MRHVIFAENGFIKIAFNKNTPNQIAVMKISRAQVTSKEEYPFHSTIVEHSSRKVATKEFHCLKISSSEVETVCSVDRI
jgi:hypothetical protein